VVAAKIIREVIRGAGIYLIPRAYKAFTKYDKQLYRQAFGPTAGRAIRHGRDAGLAIGGSIKDSMENAVQKQRDESSSRKQRKTRRGYRNQRRNKYRDYCPPCPSRR